MPHPRNSEGIGHNVGIRVGTNVGAGVAADAVGAKAQATPNTAVIRPNIGFVQQATAQGAEFQDVAEQHKMVTLLLQLS